MKRKWIAAALIAAFFAIPVAIKFAGGETRQAAELAKVEQREIRPVILATGYLVFRQEVQLSAEVIGKVAEVLVKEGDKVAKGQILLRLDPTVYLAEVAQQEANRRNASINIERAQINLANQRRSMERTEKLYKEKFIDVSKYDEARHQVELAQVEVRASGESLGQATALLSQARERLAKTEVKAPITGTVTAAPIKVGETAVASATGIAGSSLMTIADISSIVAEVNVDEADIARVAVGQPVKVFPAAFPDKPVTGSVESVAMVPRAAQPGASQGRNYVVKLRLNESGLALRSGMTSRVEIATGGGTPHPAIPLQALLSEEKAGRDGKMRKIDYVYALIDGKAHRKEVELGLSDDAYQEVLKGLAVGDTIAIGPARVLHELHEGTPLVAQKTDAKPTAGARP